MSFETGSISLMICPLRNPLPEDYLERFAKYSAGKLDDVKDEPVMGWVSGRHLLENRIDETTSMCGGFPYLNLRKTERKVPSQLLNAVCRRDELAYMQANDCLFVPRKEKCLIKEEAVQSLMPKMVPTISAVPFVVDTAANVLYFGSTSLGKFDVFVMEFTRALGSDVEPVPLSVDDLMMNLLKKNETDLPPLTLMSLANGMDEPQPGRDFLTWLWYEAEVNGGRCSVGNLGDFVLSLEGPLTLAYSPGKTKDPDLAGSGESVIKRGNTLASGEAKAALSSGKKLRKARLTIAREGGDAEVDKWVFTFDADAFTFGSVKLPVGEEMERESAFEERISNLHVLHTVFEAYFKKFAAAVMNGKNIATEKAMRQWVADRESM